MQGRDQTISAFNDEEFNIIKSAEPLINMALKEDIGSGDITSSILADQQISVAYIIAKTDGVIAGLDIAKKVFHLVDPDIEFFCFVEDGESVVRKQKVCKIQGPVAKLLTAERTALNFLQQLSGIASYTRKFVDIVKGTKAVILDTRKTRPGYRVLDKYAVKMGGGENHRMGLYDMALIKENHIEASGGIEQAVELIKEKNPSIKIEVEVKDFDELKIALNLAIDRIMLDNMSCEQMQQAVELVAGKIPLEASGNVNLETVRAIAETGVDYISIGALTHSARVLDLSLLLENY